MDLSFTFEGKTVPAREGQSIAGALLGAGEQVLSYSAKYRRPRGLRCGTGACPGCQLRVNGLPGVTSCIVPARQGDVVARERPFARGLPLSSVPRRFTGAGFYYRRAKSTRQWRRVAPILAKLAGVAEPPAADAGTIGSFEARKVDALVVGAGRTGLERAIERAQAGREVLLVDRDHRAGGRLLNSERGRAEAAERLAEAEREGVRILLEATAIGTFDEGLCGVTTDAGLIAVEAGEIVRAAGSIGREYAFPDGDRPGVMLAGAVERLVGREGIRPGSRAVIAARAAAAAEGLEELLAGAGVDVAGSWRLEGLRRLHGRNQAEAVTVQTVAGSKRVECDLLVLDAGSREADEHVCQADLGINPMAQATALAPASERTAR